MVPTLWVLTTLITNNQTTIVTGNRTEVQTKIYGTETHGIPTLTWTYLKFKLVEETTANIFNKSTENLSTHICFRSTGQPMAWLYFVECVTLCWHSEVIMSAMASQISGVSIVCSIVCWGADQRKHQSSASQPLWWNSTGHRWIPLTKGQ